jgi:hypothetical protein
MRFRHGAVAGKIYLGRVDVSPPTDQPAIGQPLHASEARHLASKILAERAAGVDVFSAHRTRRSKRRAAFAAPGANSFATCAKLFVDHARETTRGWRRTASVLGLS